jgi:hypothetical protein
VISCLEAQECGGSQGFTVRIGVLQGAAKRKGDGEPMMAITVANVHHYGDRQYVMLRRYATLRQAMDDGENTWTGEIASAYRVTEDGKLTRIVRWPLELGGNGGAR